MAKSLDRFPGDPVARINEVEEQQKPKNLIKITDHNADIEVITKALTALAWRAGSYGNAMKDLESEGFEVSRSSLETWEKKHAELYSKIRDNFSSAAEAEIVRNMRDRIAQADTAERLAIERTIEGLSRPGITGKDASQAAFNLARVKKENVDKLQNLLGRPTQIIEDRSAEQAIKRLIAKRILKPVSNGAEEND